MEAEEEARRKKKSKLDLLPPSALTLDAVKKTMWSEKPFNPKFFSDYIWKVFDAQGYSFWSGDYKYNEDNKSILLTSNLIGGYVQRCDEVRKYAMGAISIVSKDDDTPPFKIYTCFMFRGNEFPDEMNEVSDSEYYTWTKMDVSKEADRKNIERRFTADKIDNLPVQDRRYVK